MAATGEQDAIQAFEAVALRDGWQFKRTQDPDSKDAWLPAKQVPSTVHQDLIDNGRSVWLVATTSSALLYS